MGDYAGAIKAVAGVVALLCSVGVVWRVVYLLRRGAVDGDDLDEERQAARERGRFRTRARARYDRLRELVRQATDDPEA